MDLSPILASLNDAQRAAVTAPVGPVLVLAGAGSGKTRVLIHRLAWLCQVENVSPHSILAVTFTNKAAGEMRGRIESLLGYSAQALWIGTFHGIAHRLLRLHWREAGLVQGFQILDSEDQLRLIKKLIKAQGLDESRWIPREVQGFINSNKDEGHRPKHLKDGNDPTRRQLIRLYADYEETCARSGVVDFAELLLRAFELWRDQPALLDHYRQRFRHVLIDEFQDTNAIQYGWMKLLAGSTVQPFAVGDDDQSIYRWRGARVENLHQFRRDFPHAKLFRLEQNYRSTATILNGANALIGTTPGAWARPCGPTARAATRFTCMRRSMNATRRSSCCSASAIGRSAAASAARWRFCIAPTPSRGCLKKCSCRPGIPYKVYGGLRFFERAEIKDALAYLRLISNRRDDASFERVVNLPTRGIGAKSLDIIRETAKGSGQSLWDAAGACIADALGPKAATAMHGFMQLIERLEREIQGLALHEQVDHVINHSGLIEHHRREKADRGEARVENLEELVSAARGFTGEGSEDLPPLAAFLAHAVLESGEGQADAWEDCIQMMTLHTAKGLEFPGGVPRRHGGWPVSASALAQ